MKIKKGRVGGEEDCCGVGGEGDCCGGGEGRDNEGVMSQRRVQSN